MVSEKYIRSDLHSLLGHLVEECAEVLAAVGKTQRFGLMSINPELGVDHPYFQERNHEWLQREMDDLRGSIGRFEIFMEAYLGRPCLESMSPEKEAERAVYRRQLAAAEERGS